jgi:hypothetical protein
VRVLLYLVHLREYGVPVDPCASGVLVLVLVLGSWS